MARYVAESFYIASIYPGTLPAIALNHGPSAKPGTARRTVYQLEPVPRLRARTKPCLIEVVDAFEDVIDMGALSIHNSKAKQPKPVDAQETVNCLLKIWTGNMVGIPAGASPGIMQIVGTFPTKDEFDRLFEMQTLYANHLFMEGERLHRESNWKEITGAMKVMCEWLGKSSLWANPTGVNELVPCPACGGQIMPKVAVCIHCRTQLRPLPKDLAELNQPVDAEVVA